MIHLDKVCILCNRLYALTIECPECGGKTEDLGLVQDFYDSYSPYEDQKIYQDGYKGYTDECCVHLLYCNFCSWKDFRRVRRMVKS